MFPNVPQPGQPEPPATLPAVPLQPQLSAAPLPATTMPLPGTVPGPAAATDMPPAQAEEAALQARVIVQRHAHNPYELAQAFGQLKAGYLAKQHHISPNATGN